MSAEKKIVNQGAPHRQTERFSLPCSPARTQKTITHPKAGTASISLTWGDAGGGISHSNKSGSPAKFSPQTVLGQNSKGRVSLWGIRFLQSCSAFDMTSCSYPVILLKRFPDFSHRLSCNESLSVVAECDSPKFEETAAAVKLMQATEQNWSGSCGTESFIIIKEKQTFFFSLHFGVILKKYSD